MDEINQYSNRNPPNKNPDDMINKIQNSLERLQNAINNRQIIDNINNNKEYSKNKNLSMRKKAIDSKNNSRKDNPSLTESNLSNLLYNDNYLTSNTNSGFNTDKRNIQRKINQNRMLNYANYGNKVNRTSENIIPKSTPGRNAFYYKMNYNRNKRNNNINYMNKKCIECGNINPPKSKFCCNCGIPLNNIAKSSFNDTNEEINNRFNYFNNNQNIQKTKSEINTNIENLNEISNTNSNKNIISPRNKKIMNNIYEDLNNIQNEELINYKKLNDLYLYGDYLENELKMSNDENIKLLEKYKAMKVQVHSLNQKKNKLKQNIEILSKKEKDLDKINTELKNGFNFVQEKLGNIDNNNEEKNNLIKELELNNKQYIEQQNNYDKEIEELKNKISLLVDKDDEENDEDEKIIKKMEIDIEEEKKELQEKNMYYMLLIKKNESLNLEINNLAKEIDLDLNEEEEKEEKDNINVNESENEEEKNKSKEEENKKEISDEKLNNEKKTEEDKQDKEKSEKKSDNGIENNNEEIKDSNKEENKDEKIDNNG